MSKKVLIIEDSALMRKHIRSILEGQGYTVETARNGEEGVEKTVSFEPDAITLDINMPVMDGITCLSLIMQKRPTPVVMVSSLTEKGAMATFEALELGAVDYVAKPGGTVSINIRDIELDLIDKVKAACRVRMGNKLGLRNRLRVQREKSVATPKVMKDNIVNISTKSAYKVVVVGVSTGGPGTLQTVLTELPADFPIPIVVAQHMPSRFTQVFAERLNKECDLNVLEVSKPCDLEAGNVYIARGDADIKIIRRAGRLMLTNIPADPNYLWHPSVEKLAASAQELLPASEIICVQLTGMGNDGAKTMAALNQAGAKTIAEAESTAVVYGMPRELVELGGADKVLPNTEIAKTLRNWSMKK